MTQKIFVDRSRHLDLQRCARLRYLGYHSGSQHIGLAPVRKSIHLVLGGAVHAGLEVLLRDGQAWLNGEDTASVVQIKPNGFADQPHEIKLEIMFGMGNKIARLIEDRAVLAALTELAKMTEHGVELDDLEKITTAEQQAAGPVSLAGGGAGDSKLTGDSLGMASGSGVALGGFGDWDPKTGQFKEQARPGDMGTTATAAEPILEITFDPLPAGADGATVYTGTAASGYTPSATLTQQLTDSLAGPDLASANQTSTVDWATPIYPDTEATATKEQALAEVTLDTRLAANAMAASGLDGYLREELAAQVEAMVRAYARRRWQVVLREFEVLEVEREGEWKLTDLPSTISDNYEVVSPAREDDGFQMSEVRRYDLDKRELWFMSRADALLRERSTSYLYIMSYKTTGAWDRRREADAQVDMQGLSEAVDIERRLGEAWEILQEVFTVQASSENDRKQDQVDGLVNVRTREWLRGCPEPPRILGVRYEYLLKGPRRQDKNDPDQPNRYVADTPLIRAYKFDGLTADDRRWAHSYSYHTLGGKSSRLDYRSWKKAPVWRYMSVAQWIDLLDRGEIQPDTYDEHGNEVDVLAEQFIPPITVYRNDDDMRDMLEQLEAEEIRVAQGVAAVQAVEGDPVQMRSALNRHFGQNRKSCSYPGACSFRQVCFGPTAMRDNPEASELYTIRTANHPQEVEP